MARVFVSVGTHPQPFDRLLREIDKLVQQGRLKGKVFAQIGNSGYEPKNFAFKRFVEEKEYEGSFRKTDIVVSHGGAGTIINALRFGKRLVVVPRLQRFGEHTNDHQLDLAAALEKQGKCIAVREISQLEKALGMASNFKPRLASNREMLVKRIKAFLE